MPICVQGFLHTPFGFIMLLKVNHGVRAVPGSTWQCVGADVQEWQAFGLDWYWGTTAKTT